MTAYPLAAEGIVATAKNTAAGHERESPEEFSTTCVAFCATVFDRSYDKGIAAHYRTNSGQLCEEAIGRTSLPVIATGILAPACQIRRQYHHHTSESYLPHISPPLTRPKFSLTQNILSLLPCITQTTGRTDLQSVYPKGWQKPCSALRMRRTSVRMNSTLAGLASPIPEELFELTQLKVLYLGLPKPAAEKAPGRRTWGDREASNAIKTLPPAFFASLHQLVKIHLEYNQLIGLPETIGQATQLSSYLSSDWLDWNQIGDEGAKALMCLANLTSLHLRSNGIGAEGARASDPLSISPLSTSRITASALRAPKRSGTLSISPLSTSRKTASVPRAPRRSGSLSISPPLTSRTTASVMKAPRRSGHSSASPPLTSRATKSALKELKPSNPS